MPRGRVRLLSDEERALRKREASKRYQQSEKGKLQAISGFMRYKNKHPARVRAMKASFHAETLNRRPKWLSVEQIKEIKQWYVDADYLQRLTSVKMEVDHIIPLQGSNVSGLHVPWNLQILTATENRQKKNKMVVSL